MSLQKYKEFLAINLLAVLAVLCLYTPALCGITEQGTGMLFGQDHAFFVTAPEGWVLDNQSGVEQGLHMVFYLSGGTWGDSPVMAYGRSVTKGDEIRTVHDLVEYNLNRFRKSGSPDYEAEEKEPITIAGREVKIYYFRGDQWGNYEAVGYMDEEKTINFLVFNARSKELFEKYIPDFIKLLRSYRNAFSSADSISSKRFDEIVERAKELENSPEGQEYVKAFYKAAGQSMVDDMTGCMSYVSSPQDEDVNFEMIFFLKADGTMTKAHVRPETALSTCFKGVFMRHPHDPPPFGDFPMYINMKVSE